MDPLSYFNQARVFVVTGKGGTGKTTLSAAMANLAAEAGLRALIVQLGTGGASGGHETAYLSHLFGRPSRLDYEEVVLVPGAGTGQVTARAIEPDTALVEYLHLHGMRRLSKRLASSGALDVIATAVPGMPDMLVLGKIKQLERAAAEGRPQAPDVIVLDAPAAGHAVRFLQSPRGLLDAAGGGPVRAQAQEVVEMLGDPVRCQVVLVTTPDETPVSETIETAQLLEDKVGAKLCAVVVNARLPVLDLPAPVPAAQLCRQAAAAGLSLSAHEAGCLLEAASLRLQRQESQAAQVARLAEELPLPRLELPLCFSSDLGPVQLAELTGALGHEIQSWEPVKG